MKDKKVLLCWACVSTAILLLFVVINTSLLVEVRSRVNLSFDENENHKELYKNESNTRKCSNESNADSNSSNSSSKAYINGSNSDINSNISSIEAHENGSNKSLSEDYINGSFGNQVKSGTGAPFQKKPEVKIASGILSTLWVSNIFAAVIAIPPLFTGIKYIYDLDSDWTFSEKIRFRCLVYKHVTLQLLVLPLGIGAGWVAVCAPYMTIGSATHILIFYVASWTFAYFADLVTQLFLKDLERVSGIKDIFINSMGGKVIEHYFNKMFTSTRDFLEEVHREFLEKFPNRWD